MSAIHACNLITYMPAEITVAILTNPALTGHLHPELPERLPIKISESFLSPDFSAQDLPYQVKIVDCVDNCSDVVVFTRIEFAAGLFTADLSYPLEGIQATYVFKSEAGTWAFHSHELWEN